MQDIINLYKQFDKYKNNTDKDLSNHILPSIQCKQYKKFEDDKGIYAFVNWAFLNNTVENNYKTTGRLYKHQWQSGKNVCLYDIIIIRKAKTVMKWVYNYFKDYLNVNESINWIRLDNNDNIYRVAKKYKREFHI